MDRFRDLFGDDALPGNKTKSMIPHPPHNRKLALSGIALTKARNNRMGMQALNSVRDEIEKVLIESKYFEGAPFSWVTLAIRYGLRDVPIPEFEKINTQYGDLPLAIEIDTHCLLGASVEKLKNIFKTAVLKALIHAGRKYERPVRQLEAELSRTEGCPP